MNTIWLIASGTFGEAMRRKVLLIFLFAGLAIILMGVAFAGLATQARDLTVTKSLGLGVISLAGVFISVILYITLIPQEIERRTIYSILSKPVQRYQFLCGKFLGGLMTVLLNIALMGLVFILLVAGKQWFQYGIAPGPAVLALSKGILMIFFQMTLLGAVAMFFSVFLSPFVNFFLTFAVWLLGNASTLTEALADPGNDPNHPKNAFVVGIFKVVHVVIPNFANYNIQNPIINPHEHITNEPIYIAWNILYAIVYTAILLTVGSLIFDKREV